MGRGGFGLPAIVVPHSLDDAYWQERQDAPNAMLGPRDVFVIGNFGARRNAAGLREVIDGLSADEGEQGLRIAWQAAPKPTHSCTMSRPSCCCGSARSTTLARTIAPLSRPSCRPSRFAGEDDDPSGVADGVSGRGHRRVRSIGRRCRWPRPARLPDA